MKFLRALFGVLFVIALVASIFMTSVKWDILDEDTWISAFQKNDVYEQAKSLFAAYVGSEIGNGAEVFIEQSFPTGLVQQVVEENTIRFFLYMRGRRDNFTVSLEGLSSVSGAQEIPREVVVTDPNTASPKTIATFENIKFTYRVMTWIQLGAIIASLLCLLGFAYSGQKGSRMRGGARLVFSVAGICAVCAVALVIIGFSVDRLTFDARVGSDIVPLAVGGIVGSLLFRMAISFTIIGVILVAIGGIGVVIARRRRTVVAVGASQLL